LEAQQLLNKAYDPHTIVQKKMETFTGNSDKFSLVYFDDHAIPSTLYQVKSRFQLPNDAVKLGRKLSGNDINVGKELKRFLRNKNS